MNPTKISTHTVNCKRGYYRWGEISQKCWQDISRGGNHKGIWVLFSRGGNFHDEDKSAKNYPNAKISTFTVSSYPVIDHTCNLVNQGTYENVPPLTGVPASTTNNIPFFFIS